jgi:hypothetical protein
MFKSNDSANNTVQVDSVISILDTYRTHGIAGLIDLAYKDQRLFESLTSASLLELDKHFFTDDTDVVGVNGRLVHVQDNIRAALFIHRMASGKPVFMRIDER